jgi:putative hydrolase of the HAD superfamily
MLRNYKVIFFDLFFTLISTRDHDDDMVHESDIVGIDRALWTKTSERQMYERSVGIVKDPTEIVRRIIHAIRPEITEDKVVAATHGRIERFKKSVVDVDPKNMEVLKAIKDRKQPLCLVSNADIIDVMGWEASPLKAYFDEAIFSYQIGMAKPDPKIYEYAMDRFNVKPEECVFIGDGGSNELVTAKELGMTTILTLQYRGVLWPESVADLELHADYTIHHLEELLVEEANDYNDVVEKGVEIDDQQKNEKRVPINGSMA